jgi:hypothetical protein
LTAFAAVPECPPRVRVASVASRHQRGVSLVTVCCPGAP